MTVTAFIGVIVVERAALARCLRMTSVRCACSTQIAAKAAMAMLPMHAMTMAVIAPGVSGAAATGGVYGH